MHNAQFLIHMVSKDGLVINSHLDYLETREDGVPTPFALKDWVAQRPGYSAYQLAATPVRAWVGAQANASA